jgi:predicted nucleic acid-binding protein
MLRVMLDTNVFDRIIETPGLTGQLQSLVGSSRLDIVVTHVQEDELAGIQDTMKRRAIQQVPRRSVPTAVFVLDVSRLGQARLGEGHEGALEYATLHGENPKRIRDGVIALTAAAEAEELEAFVTLDDRLARRVKAKAKTLKVWNFTEFQLRVSSNELIADRPEAGG